MKTDVTTSLRHTWILAATLCAAVLTVFALTAPKAQAQTSGEPLTVAWSEIVPLFRAEPNGRAGGFGAELMREISARAGFDIRFRKFATAEEMIRAQARGETDILPAIAALPLLAGQSDFSAPVAETSIRVFVRSEEHDLHDPATMAGVRIAIPSVPLGAEGDNLLSRNVPMQIPVGTHSLTELLRGTVDAVIASDSVTLSDAYALRLDHRIVAVGPPIRRFDRVIALNRDHADLLEPINAAIAALEADGTLQSLREVTQIAVPPPEPEVLTVGVYHFPPYNVVRGDGTFTGFSVETLRNLAEAAALDIEFVEISREEWGQGPGPDRYDLITQAGISDERRLRMDFSYPVDRSSFEVFVRAGERRRASSPSALEGLRVGVEAVNQARRIAEARGLENLRVFEGQEALLRGLIDGEVDAVIYPRQALLAEAARTGEEDAIEELEAPFHAIDRAVALRFGLGQVRERLNAVIPGYLSSSANETLRRRWLGTPAFWNDARVRWLITALGATTAALFLLAALATLRSRRHLAERRKLAAELVEEVPIGMMVLSPQGRIEFANNEIKSTPGGRKHLREGSRYVDAVREIEAAGQFDFTEQSRDWMLAELIDGASLTEHSMEFRLKSGKIFRRIIRRLSDGSTLLIRLDVTEERNRTREIQALNSRLAHQIDVANLANEELRAFAYATSHDLKAPTNTSLLLLDALEQDLEGRLDDAEAKLLNELRRSAERMARLIDDVLGYTGAIGSELKLELLDLNAVLGNVLYDLKSEIEASGAQVTVEDLPVVTAHTSQMHQLFQNLISNAIKFRAPDRPPKVTVRSVPAETGNVAIEVIDNGIGIDPDKTGKIFELFFRLHTRREFDGTGLGLSICQRIARNHGGRVTVRSDPGAGSTFTVTFQARVADPYSIASE